MAVDISGSGSQVSLIASNTFPVGIIITQFSDDADAIDIPSIQIGDSAMGLNGDLITWSKANPLKLTLNVIPFSVQDDLLAILLEANRVGKGKISARDVITLTVLYPNNDFTIYTNGLITDGMPGNSVQGSGRLKTKAYSLTFENKIGI
jgi:hypothetical protein